MGIRATCSVRCETTDSSPMLGCPIVQVIGRWYSATRHRAPMTPRQRNSLIWRLVKACLAAELLYCVYELLIFDMVFFLSIFLLFPLLSLLPMCLLVGVIASSKFQLHDAVLMY